MGLGRGPLDVSAPGSGKCQVINAPGQRDLLPAALCTLLWETWVWLYPNLKLPWDIGKVFNMKVIRYEE